jgi:hypothetical protein
MKNPGASNSAAAPTAYHKHKRPDGKRRLNKSARKNAKAAAKAATEGGRDA